MFTGPDEVVGPVHHAHDAVDQVVDVAERAVWLPSPKMRDVLVSQRLADEVGDDASVERVHARAVGVEDAHDADVHLVHAVVVEEERLGGALALVVAGAGADGVHVAAVGLGCGCSAGSP
jgi:hypothetical protein